MQPISDGVCAPAGWGLGCSVTHNQAGRIFAGRWYPGGETSAHELQCLEAEGCAWVEVETITPERTGVELCWPRAPLLAVRDGAGNERLVLLSRTPGARDY